MKEFIIIYFLLIGAITFVPSYAMSSENGINSKHRTVKFSNVTRTSQDGSFGYVLLNPKEDLSAQLTKEHTIYDIQTTLNLHGKSLDIPAESILKFSGGKIVNGKISFNMTYLDGLIQFSGCSFTGHLLNEEVILSRFGASPNNDDNSAIINDVMNIAREVVVIDGLYPIKKSLVVEHKITLRGLDLTESIYGILVRNAKYGFKTTSNITAIRMGKRGSLSMFGISVLGNEQLYISGNTHDIDGPEGKPLETCGILMTTEGGSLDAIDDCSFVGFTYGIRAIGRYIEKIRSSYFSSCRFGLFTAWTSDYICEDCHFNTNMLNYNIQTHGIDDTMPNDIRKIGAGVVCKGSGMARFINCKFEFNFIHFILDEAGIILNLENCMFDAATHSSIMIFNEKAKDNWLIDKEIHKPSINCINISGNTFARGSRCERYKNTSLPGSAIMYIREAGNRGMNINFVNNVVVDNIEVDQVGINYEKTIFRIFNEGEGGIINSSSNDFSHCEAETVAEVVNGSNGRFIIKDNGSNFGNISHQFQNNQVIDIQKMELNPEGKIVIWKTLTKGNEKSSDIILHSSN